jgi:hypothetical protein
LTVLHSVNVSNKDHNKDRSKDPNNRQNKGHNNHLNNIRRAIKVPVVLGTEIISPAIEEATLHASKNNLLVLG